MPKPRFDRVGCSQLLYCHEHPLFGELGEPHYILLVAAAGHRCVDGVGLGSLGGPIAVGKGAAGLGRI